MEKHILIHEPLNFIEPLIYAYLGENPNINSLHTERDAGVYGIYNCSQAPVNGIAILEVLPYSSDWCIQRFTTIGASSTTYQRCYYSGTTWSDWRRIYYASE